MRQQAVNEEDKAALDAMAEEAVRNNLQEFAASLMILDLTSGLIYGNQSMTNRERSSRNECVDNHIVQSIITKTPTLAPTRHTTTLPHVYHVLTLHFSHTDITLFTHKPILKSTNSVSHHVHTNNFNHLVLTLNKQIESRLETGYSESWPLGPDWGHRT